jgi:hypothetical protein
MDRHMRFTVHTILCAAILLAASCGDDTNPVDNLPPADTTRPPYLTASQSVVLSANRLSLVCNAQGNLSNGLYGGAPGMVNGTPALYYQCGPWVATIQEGEARANLAWTGSAQFSNYTSTWGNTRAGVFLLTTDSLTRPVNNWPVEHGAPVYPNGDPRVYGDAMSWVALRGQSVNTVGAMLAAIRDLRVTQAVYAYNRSMLETAIFVRLEYTNLSGSIMPGLYAGWHTDADLDDGDCAWIGGNSTGYDSSRGLSYTYDARYRGDSDFGNCSVPVTGIAFLELPSEGITQLPAAHRIVRKGSVTIDPGFSEQSMQSPLSVLYALQGRSNFGDPMYNPVDNVLTKYAFTGNPVTESGWLDYPLDVRSLLSAGSFELQPGETRTLTLVLLYANGPKLSSALESLTGQLDWIREHDEYWHFD